MKPSLIPNSNLKPSLKTRQIKNQYKPNKQTNSHNLQPKEKGSNLAASLDTVLE